ncbi:MAG TPA: hypothetical protein PLK30_26345 [Blastocatellia bacterium]|nr:hypothetical protein [Blastocatellia bacterium]
MKRNLVFSAIFLAGIVVAASFLPSATAQTPAPTQLSNQPLTLQDLNILLRRSVGRNMTEADLAVHVGRVGLAFEATPEAISRLRANGAHPHLLNAIKRASEKLSASYGKLTVTGTPPPDPFLEETRKNVRDYLEELPDFICQQEIQRYYDVEGSGAWDKADTLTYELTYNHKRESYKPINAVGRALTKEVGQTGGAFSTGNFAVSLAELFNPDTKAIFKPAGKERLGNRPTVIYDYTVPLATSKLTVEAQGSAQITAGYSGSIWIDTEKKLVLKIEQAVDDLPKSYPVTNSDSIIDYDMVKLRGVDVEFLLPIRAEFMIGDRRLKQQSRNMIYFKFYRKFETDIKFVDDPQAPVAPPTKPPEKP